MTIDNESLLNLEQDEVAVEEFIVENNGGLVRDDRLEGGGNKAVYWMTLHPRSAQTEEYIARIEWFSYPYEPPSIQFAIHIRGSIRDRRAWPKITGYRAASFDICRPMSREGYALHPEWKRGSNAWIADGNPFLWVVQMMHFHINNDYQGRST